MTAPTLSSDRNLLFGLLALQMDFVTQQQLIEAMHAWMLEKQTALGELLVRRGAIDEDDRADVEKLLAKHVRKHGGEHASLAAVRVGDDVRSSLAALGDEVRASLSPPTPPEAVSLALTVPSRPEREARPSRYTPLREHAKGSLGEVSVARDEELGREVALKQIQERFADNPGSRARFVREAEITGHLEHPGVVPVYGLGVSADGRPYYAMRFIRGESMEGSIKRFHKADDGGRDPGERSLALRELLGRFVAVCDAVGYAHSRGVIHRDLKPANVMLGEYGETLVVDWGLARVMTRDDPEATTAGVPVLLTGSGSATETGQVLGTPAFMAPEQARGEHDRAGPASDVFSLGAILYDLLSGKPPFAGASAAEVLEQARKGDVVPARRRKASVPRSLEAVCARALAASPGDRYPGAKALGAEVRRWLADEPVTAYREPVVDRARRWGRRHRSVVSAGVMLLLAGVVGLGAVLWAVNREKTQTGIQRDRAVEAERQARANLKRSEENLTLARDAINECFTAADTDEQFQGPRMEKVKKLLFKKTLPFYKRFRSLSPDDPRAQFEEAKQWHRVGHIEHALLNTQESREAYETSREKFAALVEAHPDEPEYQYGLARAHNNLGLLLADVLGKHEEARKEYEQARRIQAALHKAHPDVPAYQNALAGTHTNLGNLLQALGRHEGARQEYGEALRIQAALVKAHPDAPAYQNALAAMHGSLGALLHALGKHEEARQEHGKARQILLALAEANPDVFQYQNYLATAINNLGTTLVAQGKYEEARKEFDEARRRFTVLARTHPDVPEFRHLLAGMHYNLGLPLAVRGNLGGALEEYGEARRIQDVLVKAHPDAPNYQHALAATHERQGLLLVTLGKREEARKEHEEARRIRAALVKAHPDVPEYRYDLAGTHKSLGILLVALGKHAAAREQFEEARKLQGDVAGAHPGVPRYQHGLAGARTNLGSLLMALGDHVEARKEYDEAHKVFVSLARTSSDVPEYQKALATSHFNLGILLLTLGKDKEARKEFDEARQIQVALVKAHPDVPEYQKKLAGTYNLLGLAAAAGQREEARKAHTEARRIRAALVKAHPDVPEYRNDLADTHKRLGILLVALREPEAAREQFDEARKLFGALVKAHPEIPQYQKDLAATHENASLIHAKQNRFKEVRKDLEEARRIRVGLVKAHPDDPQYQTALVATVRMLGVVLVALREPEAAREEFVAARTFSAALAKAHPENLQYQSELASSHFSLGGHLMTLRKRDEARKEFEDARRLYAALAKAHPKTSTYRVGLARACRSLGDLLREEKRHEASLPFYDRAIEEFTEAIKLSPGDVTLPPELVISHLGRAVARTALRRFGEADADWDRFLATVPAPLRADYRRLRTLCRARAGDYLRAASYVEEQSDNESLSGPTLFIFCGIQALNAHHAARDGTRPLPEREKRAEGYAKDAIALLKRAKDAGVFSDPKALENLGKNDDFDSLRDREDFKRLIAGLKQK